MPRMPSVPVAENVTRALFENEIKPLARPVILKGLASSWPCVQRAAESPQALGDYLKAHGAGKPLDVATCPKEFGGLYFYNADMTGFNFTRGKCTLSQMVDRCLTEGENGASHYVQATKIDDIAPSLAEDFSLDLIDEAVRPRLWLGNSLITQTHFDMADNIAVHVAGEKVFTLFPPDQIGNLYPGPIDVTLAGVPISMVPLDNPDFERFPRFRQALDVAQEARLEPGDALYLPALWWHHVSTKGPLNMLVNYWWNECRQDIYSPIVGLYMAAMSFKHMPAAQREGWAAMVKYLVFDELGDPVAHLPEHVRSIFTTKVTTGQMEHFKARFRRSFSL